MYPRRRVPGLVALADEARAEFCELSLDLLRRFDRLFDRPAPYISAWHQAPVRRGGDDFALHLELFTLMRAPGKLKYLAGSESGMGAFANDIAPETAADDTPDLAPGRAYASWPGWPPPNATCRVRSSVPRRSFSSMVPPCAVLSASNRSSALRTGWPAAATIRSP